MKKILLTLVIAIMSMYLYGQTFKPDSTKKNFNNAITIDATGLLQQFFNLSNNGPYYYPYMISYNRIFKKNNAIRLGASLNFDNKKNKDVKPYFNVYNYDTINSFDTLDSRITTNNFTVGLGYAHFYPLSKRWTFYFGIDIMVSYLYDFDLQDHSITAYVSTQNTTITNTYSLSPLLGVFYKLNSRLSLGTETSYNINYIESKVTKTYYSSLPNYIGFDNQKSKNTGFNSQFNLPVTINFRIQF